MNFQFQWHFKGVYLINLLNNFIYIHCCMIWIRKVHAKSIFLSSFLPISQLAKLSWTWTEFYSQKFARAPSDGRKCKRKPLNHENLLDKMKQKERGKVLLIWKVMGIEFMSFSLRAHLSHILYTNMSLFHAKFPSLWWFILFFINWILKMRKGAHKNEKTNFLWLYWVGKIYFAFISNTQPAEKNFFMSFSEHFPKCEDFLF